MLLSMGLQRVGHDLVTKQQQQGDFFKHKLPLWGVTRPRVEIGEYF